MKLPAEISTEYLRNIDTFGRDITLSDLEKAPPCRMYYDMGDQLKNYVHHSFRALLKKGEEEKKAILSGGVPLLERRKKRLYQKMLERIGGLPESSDSLNAQVTGTVKAEGYHMEKIIFTPRNNVYVTGNLYLPDSIQGKTGAVLFLCGHGELAKAHITYQRVCHLLAQSGLAAFIMDPVGQGERFSYIGESGKQDVVWGCPEHDYVGGQILMAGHSSARYFVHDAMRAIDYLISRPEIDADKIGVTGSSGGGTQTSLMMMLDPRIAAAAPGTFITTLDSIMCSGVVQDAEQIWNGLVQEGFDHDDIFLMMAPRPALLLGVAYDFFPIEGVQLCYEKAKQYYGLYGKAEAVSMFVDSCEHQYSFSMAKKAVEFFSYHLLGRSISLSGAKQTVFATEQCLCTKEGQVSLAYPGARFMFHENKEECRRIIQKRLSFSPEERKARAFSWLNEKVCANRPPCPFNLRRLCPVNVNEMVAETFLYWSSKEILSNILYFKNCSAKQPPRKVTLAVWDGGTGELESHREFLQARCTSDEAVAILDLSGYGAMKPNRINTMPQNDFEGTFCGFSHHMIWQDDSLTALRAYEVVRAISLLKQKENLSPSGLALYAEGYCSIPTAIAAFLSRNDFSQVEFRDYPPTMESQVNTRLYDSRDIMNRVLPGALEFFDYQELRKYAKESCFSGQ